MKIKSVQIKNFRSFKNEKIDLTDYTCFVGPNGAGKSTVLCALNIFFRQYRDSTTDLNKLSMQDFHHKNTSEPVTITVTFDELSDEAKESLSDYVRHGLLVVSAVADFRDGVAEVKQFGNRLVLRDFAEFFEMEKSGAKVSELKEKYKHIRENYPDLRSPGTKAEMIDALRAHEAANPDECEVLPSEDQFYGVSKGVNRLAPHIQWLFIPAVKDASTESEENSGSALGQLLSRTVRSRVNFDEQLQELKDKVKTEYQEILDAQQGILDELSTALDGRLKNWAHPSANAEIKWRQDSEKSVKVENPFAHILLGEKGFQGELARFGHGLQRSYVLALLHELSQLGEQEHLPNLVLGIEEPELFQHPPQARHLAHVLQQLSGPQNQVLLCTHSPLFINGSNFEQVRMVRGNGDPVCSSVRHMPLQDLSEKIAIEGKRSLTEMGAMAKVHQALTPVLNELFFSNILIIVEGYEDIAYLQTYFVLMGLDSKFREFGCHIVPANGKSEIPRALAIASHLGIPTFVLFDADSNAREDHGERERHRLDNELILKLADKEGEPAFPDENRFFVNLAMWKTNITDVVKQEIAGWDGYVNNAAAHFGNASNLKKNSLAIGLSLELAWNDGNKSNSLKRLVKKILDFAEANK